MARPGARAVLLLSLVRTATGLLAACWAGACASSDPPTPAPAACTPTLPDDSDCDTATPSYATEVAPLVQDICLQCHFAGNKSSSVVLETQAQIAKKAPLVQTELYRCSMPPADGPALSNTGRQLLLKWLVCGAPDN